MTTTTARTLGVIPEYTDRQSDGLFIVGVMLATFAVIAIGAWLLRAAVRRWGAGHVAAGSTGVMLAASLIAVALYRLLTWPLRAHRRGAARVAADQRRQRVTR